MNWSGLVESGSPMNQTPAEKDALRRVQDRFILEWGRMSSSWGINRTMAQIHALLFVTGESLEVNDIMDRLQISRGNASMNLRELMDWASFGGFGGRAIARTPTRAKPIRTR